MSGAAAAPAVLPAAHAPARGGTMARALAPRLVLGLYILFLLVPIYWLVNMSLKTNFEISTGVRPLERKRSEKLVATGGQVSKPVLPSQEPLAF